MEYRDYVLVGNDGVKRIAPDYVELSEDWRERIGANMGLRILPEGKTDCDYRADIEANKELDSSAITNIQYNPNLENRTGLAQDAPERGAEMAKHRMRVCVGYNDDGSAIVRQISADGELALADRIVRTVLQSKRGNEFVREMLSAERENTPTFKTYSKEYMRIYKEPRLKPTTLSYYNQMLNSYLYPRWENVAIDRIQSEDIQLFLNDNKHLSEKYLKEMRVLLKSILESAKQDKLIEENPASDKRIQIPSKKKTVRKPLELNEIVDIATALTQLEERDRRFVALAIYTGMRRGEILGLRWEDIDFEAAEIHVQRNVTFPGGQNQPHIGSTKTEGGVRTIPIMAGLTSALQPAGTSGFVIGNDKPITMSVMRRMLERIGRTINMHGASPHIFRHSFATMLNDAGTDIKTIQSILGDADFKTVVDRYVHPRENRKRIAAENVEKMLVDYNSNTQSVV